MDNFALFASLAGLMAVWSQIRVILDRIRGIFVQRSSLTGQVAITVSDYLYSNTRIWRWGDLLVRSDTAWVRPRHRIMEVAFETASVSPVVSLWRKRPLLFLTPVSPHHGIPTVPDNREMLTLITIRGTLSISDLIREAIEWQSSKETTGKRYYVNHIGGRRNQEQYSGGKSDALMAVTPVSANMIRPGTRYLHWNEGDIGAPCNREPFKSYSLSASTAACRDDFRRWCGLKDWYLERGIPWRRGHLLYGPPGTGKTALVRALAQEADFPVYAYDLSTLGNEEFRDAWRRMQESAPCIALIEDIDGVFHGRKNVLAEQDGMRSSLTFDCLLNAIGGIQTADGVFLVITTNKPELLDEALGKPDDNGMSSRPGRIDRAFLIPLLGEEGRASIIQRICGSFDTDDINATDGMSAAQVTEYAINKALENTWKS